MIAPTKKSADSAMTLGFLRHGSRATLLPNLCRQRSENKPLEYWLEVAEATAQIVEGQGDVRIVTERLKMF